MVDPTILVDADVLQGRDVIVDREVGILALTMTDRCCSLSDSAMPCLVNRIEISWKHVDRNVSMERASFASVVSATC